MGMRRGGGNVVGRANSPDNPAGDCVGGGGPITPQKPKKALTFSETARKADVEVKAMNWAEAFIFHGGGGLWCNGRNKERSWVVTRDRSFREEAGYRTEPGPLWGDSEISRVPGEGLELRTAFSSG